jgi:hypothetical protein
LRISTVIPTYQRRDDVLRAVDSAMRQERAPDEVIVVDDGSTDGTADALEARFGSAVRVLRQDNCGPARARNAAVALAAGDVVAFLDSDNVWFHHHIAVVEALFVRHPDAVLVSTQRSYRFGSEDASGSESGDLAEQLLLGVLGVGCLSAVGVRRATYVAAGGFDENLRYGEDTDLFLRLALAGPMALIAGRTFERGTRTDSLYEEGHASGAYLTTTRDSAARVLAALDHASEPVSPRLRAAAEARAHAGAALVALGEGAPAARTRGHLAAMCDRAPVLRARPASFVGALSSHLPGWRQPRRRLRALSSLVRAWPHRRERGFAVLLVSALIAAVRAEGVVGRLAAVAARTWSRKAVVADPAPHARSSPT